MATAAAATTTPTAATHLAALKQQQQVDSKRQVSVLAQANPVIISAETTPTGSPPPGKVFGQLELLVGARSGSDLNNFSACLRERIQNSFLKANKHQLTIQDELVIHKQNATNQMRQAAVQLACQSQQKIQQQQQQQQQVRLSATERLAMTAKRPLISYSNLNKPVVAAVGNDYANQFAPRPAEQSVAPKNLPTLETLLAVQRQLQQHTKQHLNNCPSNSQAANCATNQPKQLQQRQMVTKQNFNQTTKHQPKPLPPTPPPPPPPLPSEPEAGCGDSYDKDLPPLPSGSPASDASCLSSASASSSDESQLNSLESQSSPGASLVSIPPPPPPLISHYLEQASYDQVDSSSHSGARNQLQIGEPSKSTETLPSVPVRPIPPLQVKTNALVNYQKQSTRANLVGVHKLNSYQIAKQSESANFAPVQNLKPFSQAPTFAQPEEPQQTPSTGSTLNLADDDTSFRFPTPPPLDELLLEDEEPRAKSPASQSSSNRNVEEEEEEDEYFQCNIPTPPLYRPQQHGNQRVQFNSSTFSAAQSGSDLVQPPALFRQARQDSLVVQTGNLLTTAGRHHLLGQRHAVSSSSPSSSSDGDNHSSNSSSSTSGIHSSIESPSSASSLNSANNYNLRPARTKPADEQRLVSVSTLRRPEPRKLDGSKNCVTQQQQQHHQQHRLPMKPVLKVKKSVHFSEKIELVCAEGDQLPNPLLARVLSGQMRTLES